MEITDIAIEANERSLNSENDEEIPTSVTCLQDHDYARLEIKDHEYARAENHSIHDFSSTLDSELPRNDEVLISC